MERADEKESTVVRERIMNNLTPRQVSLLQLRADGLSVSEMAQTLSLAESTVKNALSQAYKNLAAKHGNHAVATALREGLIT